MIFMINKTEECCTACDEFSDGETIDWFFNWWMIEAAPH